MDGGRLFPDGRPWLGPHKTVAGLAAGIGAAFPVGLLLGLPPGAAALTGALAMAGDLVSSFIKRRLAKPSGEAVPVLDQLFEALFPLLYLAAKGQITILEGGIVLVLFTVLAFPAALFNQKVLKKPPPPAYPRLVRSATRFKEWRACHQPIAVWQRYLNFEYVVFYEWCITALFKILGLYRRGRENTLNLRLREAEFRFPDLPDAFDSLRILLLSDLHIDGTPGLAETLIRLLAPLETDLCLVAGDIRWKLYGSTTRAMAKLRQVTRAVRVREGIFGVLGNHDCIEMIPDLEDAGIVMLVNDSLALEREGQKLWLVGVDDPHYYKCHDLDQAFKGVPEGDFAIFLAHSPELIREAEKHHPALYLCGHTHAGQIRLPRLGPLFTHSRATPRRYVHGAWRYRGMQGYTTAGVGSSTVMVRFNCDPEVTVITLRRMSNVE